MLTMSVIPGIGIDTGTLILIAAAIAVALYLRYLEKKHPSSTSTHEPLTAAQLDTLSDADLVRAVAADILSKTNDRHPDVYALLPTLSHGQTAVYSVWVVCNELREASFEDASRSKSRGFCELAADGFSLIGATACEQALITLLEDPSSDEPLRAAIETEQPLTLCAAYIRENPSEFL